ncbi:MAG: hypothetical protein EZS28_013668 [Streblomastix strix]|uniref:Uncharacterized protein n=1 Tax=Streblomastix strix TaxID=222440 RepID=A0A5J4W7X2_9EUKA|nr:MAG: hypothetical protein EZS28_013668 [Streblomastix strix]
MCLGYETHEAVRLLHRIRLYLDFSLEMRKIREKEKRVKQALKIESVNEKENKDKEKEQLNNDQLNNEQPKQQIQRYQSIYKRYKSQTSNLNKDQPTFSQSFNVQDLNCFDPITTTSILPLLSAILSKLLQFLSPSSHIPALLTLLLRLVTGTIQNKKEIEKQTKKLKRIAIKNKKKESKLKDIDSQLNEIEDNQLNKNGVLSDVMHIIAHFIGTSTMEGDSYFPQFQNYIKDKIHRSMSVLNMDNKKLNDAKVHFEQFLAEQQKKHLEEQKKKKEEEKKLAQKLDEDNAAVSDGLDPQWPKLLLAYTTSSKILLRLALHLIVGNENAALLQKILHQSLAHLQCDKKISRKIY